MKMVSDEEKSKIAKGWLRYSLVPDDFRDGHPDFIWWDKLIVMAMNDPMTTFDIAAIIFQFDLSDSQISELAAGPIEEALVNSELGDLPCRHNHAFQMLKHLKSRIWTKRLPTEVRLWLAKL